MVGKAADRAPRLANPPPAAMRCVMGLRQSGAVSPSKPPISSAWRRPFAAMMMIRRSNKQAVVIASHELVLRAISAQQIAVVERLRDPSAIALAKGDNRLQLAKARFLKSQLAYSALIALRDRLLEKYTNESKPFQHPDVVSEIEEAFPPHLEELLEEKGSELSAEEIRRQKGRFYDEDCIGERDESAAMEEAASA